MNENQSISLSNSIIYKKAMLLKASKVEKILMSKYELIKERKRRNFYDIPGIFIANARNLFHTKLTSYVIDLLYLRHWNETSRTTSLRIF